MPKFYFAPNLVKTVADLDFSQSLRIPCTSINIQFHYEDSLGLVIIMPVAFLGARYSAIFFR